METQTMTDPEEAVKQASAHLYEALTHHYGPLDLAAHQPIVRAISEYGQRCREHDEEGQAVASRHVYEALTHHFGPRDLAANDPVVRALAEYGEACRRAGVRKS
ncbi:hypothetical protein [Tepidiforma sp.]|uniref:hypothetical protein n=1 Tax=Tepidiforma sp. TaxID=2682230 RepID=UPI002ADDCD79|nr:hypothetical protein [Tepidiforma sp.]